MENSRRNFIKQTTAGSAGLLIGGMGFSAKSYGNIVGANERVRVGVIAFSDRFRNSLFPCFMEHAKKNNFELTALSDLWSIRREEGKAFIKEKSGWNVDLCRNNEELYDRNNIDAVFISTADFQHAIHLEEAVKAKKDAYCEKPFAETMDDAQAALKAVKSSGIIVQIGSQRRSGENYIAAYDYFRSGKFGDIVMAEMCWNVNQPWRWRRPELCATIKEADTDWKRFLCNRPFESWDPRKYLEYRLFWPYSSGIPGQWMCHQIDTVHWFTGLPHPRSVSANGGIYQWKDGRRNADTLTAVFDYGPLDDLSKGFQVVYTSRFSNSDGDVKEIYYSNSGKMDLATNQILTAGALTDEDAAKMNLKAKHLEPFTLPQTQVATNANTSADPMCSAHILNWMECIRSRKQTNAPVEAGYNHAIACVMANAAYRTGQMVTFDPVKQQVMAGSKVFKY